MVGARDDPERRALESASPISSGRERHLEDWAPPEEFDEYRLVRPLGRGSMGQVFLAQDRVLDRPVAIKFISSLTASENERERFLVEARAAARLHHPNIMAIYRVGELEGNPYLVCEYIHGKSLSELELPLSWQQVHKLAIGLARGLANAHRHGVLHRDIKLANVMVDDGGEVKILDFSLAKLIRDPRKEERRREKREKRRKERGGTRSRAFPATGAQIDESALEEPEPEEDDSVDLEDGEGEASDASDASAAAAVPEARPLPPIAGGPPRPKYAPLAADERGAAEANLATRPKELPEAVLARIDALNAARDETMLARLSNTANVSVVADTARRDAEAAAAAAERSPSWFTDSRRAPSLTQVGALMGTPHYMAPELWHGEPASRSSDVYATGIVLYALITGRTPYAGLSLTELAAAILEGNYPAIDRLAPNADPRLVSIIERCLRLNPGERYASGDELRSALEILTPVGRAQQVPTGNPYRGLRAFEAEHRSLFFGRSLEIRAVVERLRSDAFVLVAGDSGVGKSSLCRAGVIPLIQDGAIEPERSWTSVAMMPGRKPLQVLTSVLAGYLDVEEETLHALITESAVTFGWYLRKQLGAGRGLIIFIDQLEELVTIADKEQAAIVGAVLAQIAAGVPGVRLMASARGDFLTRVAEIPELGEEISRAIYLLRPLTRGGAREAIAGPAELQGVRFESDKLVEALIDAGVEGSLPLLQFALAELWEVRDREGAVITRANLETIGGVTGALARHGDGVLASLLPQARTEARRILVRLVTIEDTRANLSEDELAGESAEARTALEALVRSRLLVVRETADGIIYEIAHEALIGGWGTLRGWLDEEREGRILLHSLETAASEWERLGKPRDALWGTAALTRASLYLDDSSLRPRERDFLAASRRSVARGRQLRRAALVAIPVVLGAVYGGVKIQEYRALQARVEAKLGEAEGHLKEARAQRDELGRVRSEAFLAFDSKRVEEGEEAWGKAVGLAPEVDRGFKEALQGLEAALILDPGHEEAHRGMADGLFERALLAEQEHDDKQVEELLERLELYDDGGLQAKWSAPATLRVVASPEGIDVGLAPYEVGEGGRRSLGERVTLAPTSSGGRPLAPGSYLLTFDDGRGRYPLRVQRSEELEVVLDASRLASVPEGFVLVPPGRFMIGSADPEGLRASFFNAAPLHTVTTGAFLVARNEVTFAEWIEFVAALPAEERADRLPKVEQLELIEEEGGVYVLSLQVGEGRVRSPRGGSVERPGRPPQDWTRWPVVGISGDDAVAYAGWLNATGRVPGARLCSSVEWERVARGADMRRYPHGDQLLPSDANIDKTYPEEVGPDEVGSHPASQSPFGVDDLVGNALEFVTSTEEGAFELRGGSFFYDQVMAHAYNRAVVPGVYREWSSGARICATVEPQE